MVSHDYSRTFFASILEPCTARNVATHKIPIFLIPTNFDFFFHARRQWSTPWIFLVHSFGPFAQVTCCEQPPPRSWALEKLKMPSGIIHCWGFRCQFLSIFEVAFQKCLAAGPAAAHNKSQQMAQKSKQQDSRSQPLAASAQEKSENWVAWSCGLHQFLFFHAFFEANAGGIYICQNDPKPKAVRSHFRTLFWNQRRVLVCSKTNLLKHMVFLMRIHFRTQILGSTIVPRVYSASWGYYIYIYTHIHISLQQLLQLAYLDVHPTNRKCYIIHIHQQIYKSSISLNIYIYIYIQYKPHISSHRRNYSIDPGSEHTEEIDFRPDPAPGLSGLGRPGPRDAPRVGAKLI